MAMLFRALLAGPVLPWTLSFWGRSWRGAAGHRSGKRRQSRLADLTAFFARLVANEVSIE